MVGEAANGEEAVAMARELEPDVVLMDLLMRIGRLPRILSRIKRPTPTRTMLNKNGARQPQTRNCSSGRLENAAKAPVASMAAAGEAAIIQQ